MNEDEFATEMMKVINDLRKAGLDRWADRIQDLLESRDEN